MFRDEYKACYDDIKGDKALLGKIMEKSKEAPNKTKVIKFNKNIISASAAVFVLAIAGFMYNMGMFDGFLTSDNKKIVITEKTKFYIAEEHLTQVRNQWGETSENAIVLVAGVIGMIILGVLLTIVLVPGVTA